MNTKMVRAPAPRPHATNSRVHNSRAQRSQGQRSHIRGVARRRFPRLRQWFLGLAAIRPVSPIDRHYQAYEAENLIRGGMNSFR